MFHSRKIDRRKALESSCEPSSSNAIALDGELSALGAPSSSHTLSDDEMSSEDELNETAEMGNSLRVVKDSKGQPFEIIDDQGISEMREGIFTPKDVFYLPPGSKIKVHTNKHGQPIRRGSLILGKYISQLVKREDMIGLKYKCWEEIEKTRLTDFLRYIRDKFLFPEGKQMDRIVLMSASTKWRNHKYYLKKTKTRNCELSKDVAYKRRPKRVSSIVWKQMVDYWYSEEFKKKSEAAKLTRAAKMHVHTTGAKSFARIRDEYEQQRKREPGAVEFFELCYQSQDGSYIDPVSADYIEAAKSYVKEKSGLDSFSESTVRIEAEAHRNLRGPDKGRVKGYGLGVKPSQVYGDKRTLDRANSSDAVADRVEVSVLRNQVENMQQMIASLQAQVGVLVAKKEDEGLSETETPPILVVYSRKGR